MPGAEEECVVSSVSVVHPLVPERKGCVRGQVITSGWHIKPLQSKDGQPCCGVTVLNITDIKAMSISTALLKMGQNAGGWMVTELKKAAEAHH